MFRIERISLRALTIALVGFLALVAMLALLVAARHFREAAYKLERQNLSRVVQVASDEVMRNLQTRLFALGTEFQARPEFRAALLDFQQNAQPQALQAVLDEPFTHGFAMVRNTDLVKLRVFDAQLELQAQNASPIDDLPPRLAPVLRQHATGREGTERFKALGGLWVSEEGTAYYSVLLPVGGFKLFGYLEVVADPAFNLREVEQMTRMPLVLYAADGRLLEGGKPVDAANDPHALSIEYLLRDAAGLPAYRLLSFSDVEQLNTDLKQATWLVVGGIILVIGLAVLIVLAILNRFVLQPVAAMEREMVRCADGDFTANVGRHMLKEFSVLAEALNAMTRQLSDKVEQLNRLSRVDSLTGLANRHHFDECIIKEWQRALRSREPLSLLMIDIDHFKAYNDHYGHLGGDECLRMVADVLRQVVQRTTDLTARYGGEEFAVLLPNTLPANALALAEELVARLAVRQIPHAASPLGRISVSIGVKSCCSAEKCDTSGLIAAADKALYQAKRAGRNRVVPAGDEDANCACRDCPGRVPDGVVNRP